MSRNYVYVVTSSEEDFFAEMAAVSMKSLKLSNPNALIIAVLDTQTSLVQSPGVQLVKRLCDQLITVDAPYESSIARSRFLKTNLISIVNQSFVYLDSDTLIMGLLDEIWDDSVDIAATEDMSSEVGDRKYTVGMQDAYKVMGWDFPPLRYLNSGVVLVNLTENVKEFGFELSEKWTEQYKKTAKVNDQYVFNYLINRSKKIKVKLLPVSLNAQFIMNPMVARDAKIVHVFSGQFDIRNDTVLHVLSKRLKLEGKLDENILKKMVETKNPWTQMDSARKYIALKDYVGAISFILKRFLKV